MPKPPRLTAREIISAIEKVGFVLVRQSGSHAIYKNGVGRRVTIPVHASRVLHPKLVKSILRDADLTVEKLQDLL
jgi:predicted RNA binding protein YcfA (HicA-like mRNA interferase family)